jgi:S1-C subfamily serine protease
MIQEITEELARQLNLATTQGALVAGVAEDSPAQRAGIQPGDIIVRFNDHAISEFRDLRRQVTEVEVGSQVELEVIRNGEHITLTAQIDEMPMEEAS